VTNIQNTALNQSVTGSAFGYGTVTLEVAGGRDIRFRRIENPETVRSTITPSVSLVPTTQSPERLLNGNQCYNWFER